MVAMYKIVGGLEDNMTDAPAPANVISSASALSLGSVWTGVTSTFIGVLVVVLGTMMIP
jgi:hypothetical protein